MRICLVSTDYPSRDFPVYVFVEQLVNALVDMKVEISVVAPQSLTKAFIRHVPLRPFKQIYETGNGNKYDVYRPYTVSFGIGKKWLYSIVDYFNRILIEKCVRKTTPTILYAHFWRNANIVLDYAIKEKLPIFVACGEGNNALEEMWRTMAEQRKTELKQAVKGVVSVSTENKRKCVNFGLADNNIIVIPNAVDERLFHPTDRNNELRHSLGVADDDFLILFVGTFIPRKGCSRLAKAIEKINDEKVKVMFVGEPIAGDEDIPSCHGIVYKGTVAHNDLPAYYASADVFVLPTLKEGCSNAIVEALAMGIPVISSDGAFNDDILNENNSLRVDPMDVDAISKAILQLKNDKFLYNQLKTYLRNEEKSHSIETRAKMILDFIG